MATHMSQHIFTGQPEVWLNLKGHAGHRENQAKAGRVNARAHPLKLLCAFIEHQQLGETPPTWEVGEEDSPFVGKEIRNDGEGLKL